MPSVYAIALERGPAREARSVMIKRLTRKEKRELNKAKHAAEQAEFAKTAPRKRKSKTDTAH
jgi:hypothetical protein